MLRQKNKFRIIAISWFLIQFIIGYFYSVKVNPVLQYSTLIFVFPFLLMFLFSFIKEMRAKFKIVITIIILGCTSCTLIFQRKHYSVFYKEPNEQMVLNTLNAIHRIGDTNKCTIELFLSSFVSENIISKNTMKDSTSIYNDGYDGKPNPRKFNELISGQTTDYFICGNLPLEYFQIIQEILSLY